VEVIKREIKFRAWLKHKSRMEYNNSHLGIALDGKLYDARLKDKDELNTPFYNPMYGEELNRENHILMQYTGLTDKNGKEIYEGDIVKVIYYEYGGKYKKVEFNLENAGFDPFCKPSYGGYEWESEESDNCEVIGNVYENPELEKLV